MAETDWIERLNSLSRVDNLEGALTRLLFLPIVAFFVQAANFVEAGANLFIDPLQALGAGAADFIDALVGGAAGIVSGGAIQSTAGISAFGFGAFPVSILVAGAGLLALAWLLSRESTSDTIPFTFTDLPLIGTEEDEE